MTENSVTPNPVILPKGYGFRRMSLVELTAAHDLADTLQIWEHPRRRGSHRYVISVDVADGIGEDFSVIQVLRCGTIEEPTEQVAEYSSDRIMPAVLAYTIQAVGQYYHDPDGVEALVAIECNNHGLSTQDTLQLHLGYTQFYRWEYYDAADPSGRFSTKIGWVTTTRTRPILLDKFHSALTTLDPVTGYPDFLTHSPRLHAELKDFQTAGALWEAEAARGAHDDHVMSAAIGYYVSWRLQGGEHEPLEDRRRRRNEQQASLARAAAPGVKPDMRNSCVTADEMKYLAEHGNDIDGGDADLDELLYDPRGTIADSDYNW